jgi:hypothetical protein
MKWRSWRTGRPLCSGRTRERMEQVRMQASILMFQESPESGGYAS